MSIQNLCEQIKSGKLNSPAQLQDGTVLADIRITGTGITEREDGLHQRPKEEFLNDDFLERCKSTPIILLHPDDNKDRKLTPENFNKHSIGTMKDPYIKGDEVWGVAHIISKNGIDAMKGGTLSTSPNISTLDSKVDGGTVEKFGEMDHIALVDTGHWDKDKSNPNGVRVDCENNKELDNKADTFADDTSDAISGIKDDLNILQAGIDNHETNQALLDNAQAGNKEAEKELDQRENKPDPLGSINNKKEGDMPEDMKENAVEEKLAEGVAETSSDETDYKAKYDEARQELARMKADMAEPVITPSEETKPDMGMSPEAVAALVKSMMEEKPKDEGYEEVSRDNMMEVEEIAKQASEASSKSDDIKALQATPTTKADDFRFNQVKVNDQFLSKADQALIKELDEKGIKNKQIIKPLWTKIVQKVDSDYTTKADCDNGIKPHISVEGNMIKHHNYTQCLNETAKNKHNATQGIK